MIYNYYMEFFALTISYTVIPVQVWSHELFFFYNNATHGLFLGYPGLWQYENMLFKCKMGKILALMTESLVEVSISN